MTGSPRASDAAPAKVRLHLDASLTAEADVEVGRDAANYLFNVMRLAVGARLLAFNGRDGEWLVEVAAAGKRGGALRVIERTRAPAPPPDLWLMFAPIKRARTDFIAEKACELGCRRIVPVFTRRTNSERVNAERLRAHAVEAAEQCGLVFVPDVAEPAKLSEVLAAWPMERRVYFCDEGGDAAPMAEALTSDPGPSAVLIGPEGGFAAEETAALRALSFVTPVTLGPRILRADTAAVSALTLWQACAGDWGS